MDEEGRIHSMQIGEVVANDDPQRLGRVRVCISGLIEPASAWAWPLGFGGKNYDVPDLGDEAAIWFRDGDVEQPWYMRAHGGMPDGATPEVPEPVKTMDIADAPLIKSHQFGNFIITCDLRPATLGMTITDSVTGEVFVEYDGKAQGLRIKAVSDLILESDGALHVIAALCEIMNRKVMVSTEQI